MRTVDETDIDVLSADSLEYINPTPLIITQLILHQTAQLITHIFLTLSLRSAQLTCCPFLVFALPLPPVVLVLQPPLCGTRSHLAFATLPLPIPSVVFLKLTASSRLLAHPSV